MSTTVYVRSVRSGEIVNALATHKPSTEWDRTIAEIFGEGYYGDAHPPLSVLQRYQYWNERP